jgi:hypothetical protein
MDLKTRVFTRILGMRDTNHDSGECGLLRMAAGSSLSCDDMDLGSWRLWRSVLRWRKEEDSGMKSTPLDRIYHYKKSRGL